ncbi:hypothetical protein ES703_61586 [subsurface metagenome]
MSPGQLLKTADPFIELLSNFHRFFFACLDQDAA